MEPYKTPGQDLFEALQWETHNAGADHAPLARDAIYDPARGVPWTWGMLPAHVKAIYSAAAARFLSE